MDSFIKCPFHGSPSISETFVGLSRYFSKKNKNVNLVVALDLNSGVHSQCGSSPGDHECHEQFHDSPSNSCRDRTLPSYAANMSSLPVVTFNHFNYFHSSIVIPLHSATTNTQLAPSDWDGCDHVTAHYWTTFSFQFKARNQRRLSLRITLHKPELQLQFVCDVQSSAYFEIVSILWDSINTLLNLLPRYSVRSKSSRYITNTITDVLQHQQKLA